MKYAFETIAVGIGAFLALLGVAFAKDDLFAAHMWVLFFVLLVSTVLLLRRVSFSPATGQSADDKSGYFDEVVRYGIMAAASAAHLGGDLRLRRQRADLATSFYVVQRTSRARLWGGNLGWFVFWGYQLFIVMAATGYLLGIHPGPGIRRAGMVRRPVADHRLGRFCCLPGHAPEAEGAAYLRGQLVLPELHRHRRDAACRQQPADPGVVLRLLLGRVISGVQDAMTQWWYGHNAVGFFLTAGFLGMMYYFIPKQAERPVYSYKLSIIHFWALIFLYIWAGPHHLHYTALPDWASTLGMVFSVVLWMPSWGGMINGLMTLSGAWDKLRTDPDHLRMMVTSVAFYGMSTFEGPMMSIRAVNSLSHYTDWTIGHVHSGALGWNGMITFGALYYLFPKLWNRSGSTACAWCPGTSGSPPSASCSTRRRCGSPASWKA
jgi:cytochrome c oxidase cbb3-type subunit 1